MTAPFQPTRRAVTASLAATLVSLGAGAPGRARAQARDPRPLEAAPMKLRLRPEPAPEIDALAFDGQVPGPVLRERQGEEARFAFANRTDRPLALHWQGVRLANAADGVGGLTQAPVAPGASSEIRFTPPDAGTFLVRPLTIGASAEPAERGLSALLVVEEREPPRVDQDIALIVDDWRLAPDGTLAPFGDLLERASTGRLGGYLAVGGTEAPRVIEAPPNSRIRLRLANACNARSMRIRFDGLRVHVAAIDGQPTDTFEPLRSTLPFAPGTRYDLFVDLGPEAGAKGAVVALVGQGVPLVTVAAKGDPLPAKPPVEALPANRNLPAEIRLQNAARATVTVAGGAVRGPDGAPVFTGDPNRIWTMNGATGSAASRPLLSVRRGSPVVIQIANQTPTGQPLHLHGHSFRLLHPKDDGWEPYWLDTLLVPENRTVQIAFVADNPGRWALSSTVLERFDAGLWTWFEVT